MIVGNIFHVDQTLIQAHGGNGYIKFSRLLGPGSIQLAGNLCLNFVDLATLPPGTSIGEHEHFDSTELYLVLEGTGLYSDNSEAVRAKAGDLLVTHGGRHSLLNDSGEDLSIFVVEVKLSEAGI